MMYRRVNDESSTDDDDDVSSPAASETGSRTTTGAESWHDVKSDNEQNQERTVESRQVTTQASSRSRNSSSVGDENEEISEVTRQLNKNEDQTETITNNRASLDSRLSKTTEKQTLSMDEQKIMATSTLIQDSNEINDTRSEGCTNLLTILAATAPVVAPNSNIKYDSESDQSDSSTMGKKSHQTVPNNIGSKIDLDDQTSKYVAAWVNPYWDSPSTDHPRTEKAISALATPLDQNEEQSIVERMSSPNRTDQTLPHLTLGKISEIHSNSFMPTLNQLPGSFSTITSNDTQYHVENSTTASKTWQNPYWTGNATARTTIDDNQSDSSQSRKLSPETSANSKCNGEKLESAESIAQTQFLLPIGSGRLETGKQKQTWTNPYWQNNRISPTNSAPIAEEPVATKKAEEQAWTNPYWKDSPASTAAPSRKPDEQAPTKKAEEQAWTNPYWKDSPAPTAAPSRKPDEQAPTKKAEEQAWTNPYWKDNPASTATPQKREEQVAMKTAQEQQWINPYWKDKASSTAISSQKPGEFINVEKVDEKSWVNPYWKDEKPPSRTTVEKYENYRTDRSVAEGDGGQSQNKMDTRNVMPDLQTQQFQSPATLVDSRIAVGNNTFQGRVKQPIGVELTNVWTLDNNSPTEHQTPSIPSYYHRIYPQSPQAITSGTEPANADSSPSARSVPPLTTGASMNETIQAGVAGLNNGENDPMPFTIDQRGVVHYLSRRSSLTARESNGRAVNFVDDRSGMAPVASKRSESTSNMNAVQRQPQETSSSVTAIDNMNEFRRLSARPLMVITERELHDICNALSSLEKSSKMTLPMRSSSFEARPQRNNPTLNYTALNTMSSHQNRPNSTTSPIEQSLRGYGKLNSTHSGKPEMRMNSEPKLKNFNERMMGRSGSAFSPVRSPNRNY